MLRSAFGILLFFVIVAACAIKQDDPFRGVPVASRKAMIVTVQGDTVPCIGAYGPQNCLVVEMPNGETEVLTEGVFGYDHIEGVAKEIRVQRVEFDRSRPERLPQDVSTIQYRLLNR